MHRLILGAVGKEQLVDHINHNGLDNRRENIRLCTYTENILNKRKILKGRSSKYKGVSLAKRYSTSLKGQVTLVKMKKPWLVQIQIDKKNINCGYYSTEEDGARAYNELAKKYFGEFAYLNKI